MISLIKSDLSTCVECEAKVSKTGHLFSLNGHSLLDVNIHYSNHPTLPSIRKEHDSSKYNKYLSILFLYLVIQLKKYENEIKHKLKF